MRKTLATIIAPLMPAALLIIVPVLLTLSWPFNESDYLITAYISVAVGYIALFIIGLPLVYWLKSIDRLTLLNLAIGGAIGGIIVISIFGVMLGLLLSSTLSFNLVTVLWGSVLGASVSLTYGAISGITRHSTMTRKKTRAC